MSQPTIVCISANPGLDRRIRLQNLAVGEINRAHSVQSLPGGKAAHVAMASRALGAHAVWLGFLGGATGEECAAGLRALGIDVVPVKVPHPTRINLEFIEDSKKVTEVLEPGNPPGSAACEEMLGILANRLDAEWKNATVAISGSLPVGTTAEFYISLVKAAQEAGSKVFLDTSGEALSTTLAAGPDFVKPNLQEAEALLLTSMRDNLTVANAAKQLITRGAGSVAITLGAEGMIWVEGKNDSGRVARAPKLNPISAVGSGDATLAGFAYGSSIGKTGPELLKLAAACGAANCVAALPGQIIRLDVERFISQVEISEIRN